YPLDKDRMVPASVLSPGSPDNTLLQTDLQQRRYPIPRGCSLFRYFQCETNRARRSEDYGGQWHCKGRPLKILKRLQPVQWLLGGPEPVLCLEEALTGWLL